MVNREKLIITYFKLNEKERQKCFLLNSTHDIDKTKLFAVGKAHFAVLDDDGRVIAYGDNSCGQCDTQGWENAAKIVAGDYHTVALLNDGTVVATGDNTYGQCNVGAWKNITDIYAMNNLTVGVQADGTVTVAARTQQNENNGQSQAQHKNNTANIPNHNQTKPTDSSSFEWEKEEDGVIITKCKGSEETVVIPEDIQGKPVRAVGFHVFWRNSAVKNVVLPKNLRSIGIGAFGYCTNLENLEIQYGTEEIGISAFYSCGKLKTLTLPESVTTIGASAFERCTNLTEIVIPDSVQIINADAFAGCNKINRVEISPQTRERVDPRGEIFLESKRTEPTDYRNFEWKEVRFGVEITKYKGNEETVVIPETIQGKPVRVIGDSAFKYNPDVKCVRLPKNLSVIAINAFSCCKNLKNVEIPYGTEEIGVLSFFSCGKLESLTLPDSVKEIGSYAFGDCTNLREIVIPDSVQSIGVGAFNDCKKINKVEISPQTRYRVDPMGEILPK